MKLEHIRKYVESQLKVDLTSKCRQRKYVYARAIYYELAALYAIDKLGRKISMNAIGKSLGRHHATVLHHRSVTFPMLMECEEKYKYAFESFKKVKHYDTEQSINQKYDVLFSDYLVIKSNYDNLKNSKSNLPKSLNDIISTINDDKIDIFIERVKPMIHMLNNAKF